jgi:hypothetical protein
VTQADNGLEGPSNHNSYRRVVGEGTAASVSSPVTNHKSLVCPSRVSNHSFTWPGLSSRRTVRE